MNFDQLQILKQGVHHWNEWRAKNKSVPINLSGVDLSVMQLCGNKLWCNKTKAANLAGINLSEADMSGANLSGANLTGANLNKCNFENATLWDCNLSSTNLIGANIRAANLCGALLHDSEVSGIKYDRKRMHDKYKGIKVENCSGNAVFKRDAQDQDYIDNVKDHISPFTFWIWDKLTDFGRSILRAAVIGLCCITFFSLFYYIDFVYAHSWIHFRSDSTWLTPLYFSFVTFTTLGFGDIYAKSSFGELLVMTEVVLGYISLGLILAILANIVARRS